MANKRDNSTFAHKVMIRQELLRMLDLPEHIIMETHGGTGQLFRRCYSECEEGIVFEKDDNKVSVLARQRPTWRVYQADCMLALQAGVGGDIPVTLLDTDPYGSCWETLAAFFGSNRNFAPLMGVVVNDGLRQKLKVGAWDVGILEAIVNKYGNKIHGIYLEICRELLEGYGLSVGYKVSYFSGYYTGHAKQMTHFLAILEQC